MDYYQFQVLQNKNYSLVLNGLNGANLPQGVGLSFYDMPGFTTKSPLATGNPIQYQFDPGTYVVGVSGWTPDLAGTIAYQLGIGIQGSMEDPPPLSIGATPVLQIRLASNPPLTTGPGPGPTPVVPFTSVADSSTGNRQPSLGNIALTLLGADPVGGVTRVTNVIQVAFSLPVQVQGLTNVPASVASNPLLPGAALLAILLASPSEVAIDPALGNGQPLINSFGTTLKEWLESWPPWLEFLPASTSSSTSAAPFGSQDTVLIESEVHPVSLALGWQNESCAHSKAIPEVMPLKQAAVNSAPSSYFSQKKQRRQIQKMTQSTRVRTNQSGSRSPGWVPWSALPCPRCRSGGPFRNLNRRNQPDGALSR